MDTIEFKLTKVEYGADNFESDAVDIFVNGKNLLNAIYDYEEKYVEGGGHVPITPYELYYVKLSAMMFLMNLMLRLTSFIPIGMKAIN